MPIAAIHYRLIRELYSSGMLPKKAHVLELGQSNWTGDVPLEQLRTDISGIVRNKGVREKLLQQCVDCSQRMQRQPPDLSALWELPQIFFKVFLGCESYTSIDLNGPEGSLKYDLNNPVKLDRQYDAVFDFGTAEHVFNVYQVFKTIHEVTRPGGLMMHALPFQGWVDHGFYNFQPTFFLDLAATNGYQLIHLVYWQRATNTLIKVVNREQIATMVRSKQIQENSSFFTIMNKARQETPFRVPIQGFYEDTVSDEVKHAWHTLR